MAGQFCFCGNFGSGAGGDAGEQGAVEDASFAGWFALVVEVTEVEQEVGEMAECDRVSA
ncbi:MULTISPECIES: hypothetical protein [Auritidibacter]|uniref:hypothetical protein n=1 Tax=Auritidibacter TaxID=1160973 RepID=UPI00143CEBE5|nr:MULTISPECIES: hypothetical protein [Auritidibacter]WGH84215.1 hypothetical protein QDX20_01330 [Auritidibacter ignavus]